MIKCGWMNHPIFFYIHPKFYYNRYGITLEYFLCKGTINYIIKIKTMPSILTNVILYNWINLEKMLLNYSNIVSNIQIKFIFLFTLII